MMRHLPFIVALAGGLIAVPGAGAASCSAPVKRIKFETPVVRVFTAPTADGDRVFACHRKWRKRYALGYDIGERSYINVQRVIADRYLQYTDGGSGEETAEDAVLIDLASGKRVAGHLNSTAEGLQGVGVAAAGVLVTATFSDRGTDCPGEPATGVTEVVARLTAGGAKALGKGCDIGSAAASDQRVYWQSGSEVRSATAADLAAPAPTPTPPASPPARPAARASAAAAKTCERSGWRTLLRASRMRIVRDRNGVVRACWVPRRRQLRLDRVLDGVTATGPARGFVATTGSYSYPFEPLLYRFGVGEGGAVVLLDLAKRRVIRSAIVEQPVTESVSDLASLIAFTDGGKVEIVDGTGRRTVDQGTISDLALGRGYLYWTNAGIAKAAPLAA